MRWSRILVACDFSRASVVALKRAAELMQPGATLEVLHVVLGPPRPPRSVGAEAPSEVSKLDHDDRAGRLEDLVKTVIPQHADDVMLTVEFGHPANRMIERSPTCDLIVLGSSRRSVRGTMTASVAEHVVRRAACSVLVVRDHQADEV